MRRLPVSIHRLRLAIFAFLVPVALASTAFAQTAPPAASEWHGGINFGFNWQNGVTRQTTQSLDASLARVAKDWSLTLMGQTVYGKITIPQIDKTQKIADADNASLLATRKLTTRTFLAGELGYARNAIQQIDYHLEELGGYGVHMIDEKRGHLSAVAIAGVVEDQKNVPAADGASAVVGILQNGDAALSVDAKGAPMWSLKERLLYLHDVSSSADSRLDFKSTLMGRIAGPVSVTLAYQIVHEGIVAGGSSKNDQRITFGLSWSR